MSDMVFHPGLAAQARKFAVLSHGNQIYGRLPYSFHLDQTVSALMRMHATTDQIMAGYLHDTIEDCEQVSKDVLEQNFSKSVADLVWACTGVGFTRLARITNKAEKLLICPDAIPVALADRYCNMRFCLEDGNESMLNRYAKELPIFLPLFLEANRAMSLEMMAWASQRSNDDHGRFSLTD